MKKNFIKISSWNIGARLALFTFLLVAATFVTLISLINHNNQKLIEARTEADVVAKTKMIVDMLNVFDAGLRSQVDVDAKIFQSTFKESVELDKNRMVDVAGVQTPVLKFVDGELNLNFSILDQFTNVSGAVATLFVKSGNEFIRINTSLKKENGDRAIGTSLDHSNPAYTFVAEGKAYTGIATLFGKQYMTQYNPIMDSNGRVIGIYFVGIDFTEAITKLKDKIRSIKIGESGYFYAIDAREGKSLGSLIIHPSKEGQVILDSKDRDGREFIKEMLQKKEGVIKYPWINTERGERESREKLAAFFPMTNWGWIVAGGVYTDEFTKEVTDLALRFEITGIFLLLILGGMLYLIMQRRLTKPLEEVIEAARNLARGDLRTHVETTREDEIGQLVESINGIGTGLAQVVKQVRSSTVEISIAAREISQGTIDLSSRTESQASSLEQTSASMHELTDTVKLNSDNARSANELAVSAANVATKGGEAVSKMMETMSSIKSSSKRIVDIIGVIDGIAFQTNILALNAAVEAARAGEQGRGFAVVATEVRNLAQRSASAAREIASLIQESVSTVEAGNQLAEQTELTMTNIVRSIESVTSIMAKISSASVEQSSGIEQVNQAVGQMDQMTQQNASLVEEAAAAAEAMHEQVEAMIRSVDVFKT